MSPFRAIISGEPLWIIKMIHSTLESRKLHLRVEFLGLQLTADPT